MKARPNIHSGIQDTRSGKPDAAFCLLLILSLFLTQCGKSPKQARIATQTPDGGFTLPLPSALKKHQSGKNITAQLIVNGGTPIDMTVDLENDRVTATTGALSPGTHSFIIQYFLDGALIATAASEAEIIAGQNTNIVFPPELTVNIPPAVLTTQPAENATAVALNSSVSATFSQPMDAASFTDLNFTLSGMTGSVAGSVGYTEAAPVFEARFTATQPLALAANYTATLNTSITGILGETLVAPHTWTFTTADGTWGNAEGVDLNSVNDPLNNAASPQIAVNANGNALAVWSQTNIGTSGPDNIWANRYVKGVGWGTPQLIESVDAGHARFPQVALDSDGNAIAVWQQSDGTQNDIWANRFNAATGLWEAAYRIETDNTGSADSPQIAVDGNGNVIAVWRQFDGSFFNIMSKRFNAELGTWDTTATPIETENNDAQAPQIAVDRNGNGIAVWEQSDGTQFSIFANRFDGSSWGTAEAIEFDNAGDAGIPKIAMDESGRAIAVWLQDDGSAINVMSNRFVPGTGWAAPPLVIDTETTQAFTPEIAVDSQGNAFALWRQSDGSVFHIFSSRFNISTALWDAPAPLETGTVSNVGFPQVTFDPNGNAIAVWAQLNSGDSFDNVWASRYTQAGNWQTAEKLETDDLGNAGFPQITLDANGTAIAVWTQNDGTTTNVQSNRFQ